MIDLERYLGGVTVDPETKRGYIGGGALWRTVNEETIKYGLATVCWFPFVVFSFVSHSYLVIGWRGRSVNTGKIITAMPQDIL